MLSIEECMRDSPQFRMKLSKHMIVVVEFEQLLSNFIASVEELGRSGSSYCDALCQFSSVLRSFSSHFEKGVFRDAFTLFQDVIKKIQNNFRLLHDQVSGTFLSELLQFSKNEVQKVRDSKKLFTRTSDNLANSINKSVSINRQKEQEADEASKNLEQSRINFSQSSVELAFQMNLLSAKKQPFILEKVVSHLESQCHFFQIANNTLKDFKPALTKYSMEVEPVQQTMIEHLKRMSDRRDVVNTFYEMERISANFQVDPRNPRHEGYLFKKKTKSAFKGWNRRYFSCNDFRLSYYKKEGKQISVDDLKLCTVKHLEEFDRRFCFEVVTPTKSIIVQAETDRERERWCQILQACFMSNLTSPLDSKSSFSEADSDLGFVSTIKGSASCFLDKVKNVPGNEFCSDCNHKDATWASVNLGVVLCIECSGIHRSLGVRVSKVKSIVLDQWEPESQQLMQYLGNKLMNDIYEKYIPLGWAKPFPDATRKERVRWISAKYKYHYFVDSSQCRMVDVNLSPNDLQRSVSSDLLSEANVNPQNATSMKKKIGKFKIPFLHAKSRGAASHDAGVGLALKSRVKNTLSSHISDASSSLSDLHFLQTYREPFDSVDRQSTIHSSFRRSFRSPGSTYTLPPPKPPRAWHRHSLRDNIKNDNPKIKVKQITSLTLHGSANNNNHHIRHNHSIVPLAHSFSLPNGPPSETQNSNGNRDSANISTITEPEFNKSESENSEKPRIAVTQASFDNELEVPKMDNEEIPPPLPPPFGSDNQTSFRKERSTTYETNSPAEMTTFHSLPRKHSHVTTASKRIGVHKETDPNCVLYHAAISNNIQKLAQAIAEGADPNYQCSRDLGATPLIQTIINEHLIASEFLMQNGAKIDIQDWNDQSALHFASKLGKTGHVCLLLKRGAKQSVKNNKQQEPLELALEAPHADIVTLLRLSKLNDNMREQDYEETVGNSVSVVFDDFSQIAVSEPARLKRSYQELPDD